MSLFCFHAFCRWLQGQPLAYVLLSLVLFLCIGGCGESGSGDSGNRDAEKLLLLDIEELEEALEKADSDVIFYRSELDKNKMRQDEALEAWKNDKMSDAGYKLRMKDLESHREELLGYSRNARAKVNEVKNSISTLKGQLREIYGGS